LEKLELGADRPLHIKIIHSFSPPSNAFTIPERGREKAKDERTINNDLAIIGIGFLQIDITQLNLFPYFLFQSHPFDSGRGKRLEKEKKLFRRHARRRLFPRGILP